ncbi:MAG: SRPBCC family protein [Alsobacter sp.]
MTEPSNSSGKKPAGPDAGQGCFVTLSFDREIDAPVPVLWQTWTAPAARAVWTSQSVTEVVEILESDTRVGGREVSLRKRHNRPDIRRECGWLDLQPMVRSVNYEAVTSNGVTQSAALVTADLSGNGDRSRLIVTVQLCSQSTDVAANYDGGLGAELNHLAQVAERTMVLQRVIGAPRAVVWKAWMNPDTLPLWWGPDGFSCRTSRIDLQTGGEWVFDMIAPDGTVFPNHHLYHEVHPQDRIRYSLLWGENGPKHADAWASFDESDGTTTVTLGMVFSTAAEFQTAKGFGAIELGLQTLSKLDGFIQGR